MLIAHVDRVDAYVVAPPIGGPRLTVTMLGLAATTGWTHGRLSPRAHSASPADNIWEFEALADPPHGLVLDVLTLIAACWQGPLPSWCKAVRIRAATNQIAARIISDAPARVFASDGPGDPEPASLRTTLVRYDDSIQPTGLVGWEGAVARVQMKKQRHEVVLNIEGPDPTARRAVADRAAAGGIAAAIAGAIASGAPLETALSKAVGALREGATDDCDVRIDDHSHWIYWDP